MCQVRETPDTSVAQHLKQAEVIHRQEHELRKDLARLDAGVDPAHDSPNNTVEREARLRKHRPLSCTRLM